MVLRRRALRRHQLVADRQEPLGDDVQPDVGIRWWMSATRPATEFSIGIMPRSTSPAVTAANAVLEGRAGDRLVVRIGFAAGDVRIRPELALEDDLFLATLASCDAFVPAAGAVNGEHRARLVQVLRRVDAERHRVDHATSMRMPASSARSCSSRSRFSFADGGSATKRSSAARR